MQKVAIVGAGHMGQIHAAAYTQIPNADLVALVDNRPGVLLQAGETYGAGVFTDFEKMMSVVNPDVIDICTPTPWHNRYVQQASAAGKHVITEKPMARTVEECREMIDATEKAGVTFMVAQVLRFFPEFAAAKAHVDSGAVGKPSVVRTSRGGNFPMTSGNWYGDPNLSGGVVLDLIIHDFDWLRWTFGDVERVYAKGNISKEYGCIDYALCTLHMKSGVIAHVEGTWANPGGFQVKFEIAGDGGMLDFQSKEASPLTIATKANQSAAGVAVPESPSGRNPYQLELQHFIDCVETGASPMVTGEDGLKSVEIALAALESIRTGKPVTIR
jgi:UDP-N-acetylglucosamine 3-dehydrogenase